MRNFSWKCAYIIFKSQNIEMNYLENTLKMIELYQTKDYFRKELF